MGKIITPYPKRTDLNADMLTSVKDFLFKSFRGENPEWPGYHCVIFVDGIPRKITASSYFKFYSSEIQLSYERGQEIPDWLPGVLIAIAVFFRLHQDVDIRTAAVEALARAMAGVILPYQQMLAETYDGRELHEIAVNTETRELAAKVYDAMGVGRYVTPSGEEVDFNGSESWHGFAVPVGGY